MRRTTAKTYVIDGTRTLSAAAIYRACVSLGANVGMSTVRERLHAGVRNLDALCAPVDPVNQANARSARARLDVRRAREREECAAAMAAVDARKREMGQ